MILEGEAKGTYYNGLSYKHRNTMNWGSSEGRHDIYNQNVEQYDYYRNQHSKYREGKILLQAELESLSVTFTHFYPDFDFNNYFDNIIDANPRTKLEFKTMEEVNNTTPDEINNLLKEIINNGVGGEVSKAVEFLIDTIKM